MRKRSHGHELPNRTHAIKDCNFLIRLLWLLIITTINRCRILVLSPKDYLLMLCHCYK